MASRAMSRPGTDGGPYVTVLHTPVGLLRIYHPPGTFRPSPATRIMVDAITSGEAPLAGLGIDWGCGTGTLAIAAARRPKVRTVLGLDRSRTDIAAARENASANGVARRVTFHVADGYHPVAPAPRHRVHALRGRLDFITANPPASRGDDGFGHRYTVLQGAMEWLRPGGVLLLQALSAYGVERLRRLTRSAPGAVYEGIVATTDAVPLDMGPDGVARELRDYAAEEERGGVPYILEDAIGRPLTAVTALRLWEMDGMHPRARWQAHLFRRGR